MENAKLYQMGDKIGAKIEEEAKKARSAWSRGVFEYVRELWVDLCESIEGGYFESEDLKAPQMVKKALLNGADSWSAYSWGGSSLIYNSDIAARLCCHSELKKTREGERRPNAREEWLDTQARALFQASEKLQRIIREEAAQ